MFGFRRAAPPLLGLTSLPGGLRGSSSGAAGAQGLAGKHMPAGCRHVIPAGVLGVLSGSLGLLFGLLQGSSGPRQGSLEALSRQRFTDHAGVTGMSGLLGACMGPCWGSLGAPCGRLGAPRDS